MSNQQTLDAKLDDFHEKFQNKMPQRINRVINAAEKPRNSVSDILSRYTDENGRIPRGKINAILNELNSVEDEIYRDTRDELRSSFQESSLTTGEIISEAILAAVGVAALIGYAGLSKSIADAGVDLSALLFNALTGWTHNKFANNVAEAPFNRTDDDGKQLNDRLRDIASTLRKEISETLRKSIRKGEVTAEILRKVRRNFEDHSQRIKTIVKTESLYVMRQSIAKYAELSGTAKGLKIVDYPEGDKTDHTKHKCFIYAHRNEYGMGTGVYPVKTQKIRHPHPRCTSTLHIVLKDELK